VDTGERPWGDRGWRTKRKHEIGGTRIGFSLTLARKYKGGLGLVTEIDLDSTDDRRVC